MSKNRRTEILKLLNQLDDEMEGLEMELSRIEDPFDGEANWIKDQMTIIEIKIGELEEELALLN